MVCVSNDAVHTGRSDPAALLAVLPSTASDVLADSPRQVPPYFGRPSEQFFEVRTADARAVAAALDELVSGPHERIGSHTLQHLFASGDPATPMVDVSFAPYMPHGEPDCGCGG